MAVHSVEPLTEEECYLATILMDKSGIDIAEFCWYSPETDDPNQPGYTAGCFRAWPFQWGWWRCEDSLQIDQCSRSCGKSLSIKVRMFAFPFVYPGQEAVITAPELVHLEPIVQLVEQQFEATRLGREMRKKLPTHRPFMYEFLNGSRIIGRIPQRDGKGVKGTHPLMLEQDEASDYPEPGWKELIETRKQGFAGSVWRSHGVTRGMGNDSFYKRSEHGQDDPPLRYVTRPGLTTVHRIVAMARPTWTDKERQEKIQEYGSKDDPDYRRNILGSHGDAQSPIFVLHRLMKCVDDDPSTENNTEYWHVSIKDTEVARKKELNPNFDITDLVIQPPAHARYKTIWMGADIGYTIDPTEILIAAEYPLEGDEKEQSRQRKKAMPKGAASRLNIIGRITLNRIPEPDQVEVIMALVDQYKPKVFAMDSTGAGLPLFQALQRRMERLSDRSGSARARAAYHSIRGYNFSSKILAEFDETIPDDPKWTLEDKIREKGIKRDALELSTDTLRSYVDDERLFLPWDLDLIQQFRAQTFTINKNARDQYGRKRIFSNGNFHALDAARMLALGHKQYALETLVRTKEPPREPVLDVFMTSF